MGVPWLGFQMAQRYLLRLDLARVTQIAVEKMVTLQNMDGIALLEVLQRERRVVPLEIQQHLVVVLVAILIDI